MSHGPPRSVSHPAVPPGLMCRPGRSVRTRAPLPMALHSVMSAGLRSQRARARPRVHRRYTPGTSGCRHPSTAQISFPPVPLPPVRSGRRRVSPCANRLGPDE